MVKTQHISKSKFTNKLNHAITKRHELDFETLSFVHVVETFFNLKPVMVDHMIWILKRLKSDYRNLCNSITYENMVIASAIYAMRMSGLPAYESITVNCFIEELYKSEMHKAETIQIYSLFETLKDLFYDSDEMPISEVDEIRRRSYS